MRFLTPQLPLPVSHHLAAQRGPPGHPVLCPWLQGPAGKLPGSLWVPLIQHCDPAINFPWVRGASSLPSRTGFCFPAASCWNIDLIPDLAVSTLGMHVWSYSLVMHWPAAKTKHAGEEQRLWVSPCGMGFPQSLVAPLWAAVECLKPGPGDSLAPAYNV